MNAHPEPLSSLALDVELALAAFRESTARLEQVARSLREREEPAEFRPSGFACTVERDPAGVTLTVRMKHATLSFPLPQQQARELAALMLVQSEGEREQCGDQ